MNFLITSAGRRDLAYLTTEALFHEDGGVEQDEYNEHCRKLRTKHIDTIFQGNSPNPDGKLQHPSVYTYVDFELIHSLH